MVLDSDQNHVARKLDPAFLALSRYRRHHYDSAVSICSKLLQTAPLDATIHHIKTMALTEPSYIDDTDIDNDTVSDALFDDVAMSKAPRPGTSMRRPTTTAAGAPPGTAHRPTSSAARPPSGFVRPGTQSRTAASSTGSVRLATALSTAAGARPGTSMQRPMTVAGRFVRLATASLMSNDGSGEFINVDKIDPVKFGARPYHVKPIIEYCMYVAQNYKRALEILSACTEAASYNDWWYKTKLGKCFYQCGMYREAEHQLQSSIKQQPRVLSYLLLGQVYLKLDQPITAIETYQAGLARFTGETTLLCAAARVYDDMNDTTNSLDYYKRVLMIDAANVEAIASLAAASYYKEQPEIALRYYRRLLQMGINNAALYTNIALSCFYANQYDMTIGSIQRALQLTDDSTGADVWYAISHIAVGIGDLNLAYQALKITLSIDTTHTAAYTNLGVLEFRKNNLDLARTHFMSAQLPANNIENMFEPYYNNALLAYKLGDCSEAFAMINKSLEANSDHVDSKDLLKTIKRTLLTL